MVIIISIYALQFNSLILICYPFKYHFMLLYPLLQIIPGIPLKNCYFTPILNESSQSCSGGKKLHHLCAATENVMCPAYEACDVFVPCSMLIWFYRTGKLQIRRVGASLKFHVKENKRSSSLATFHISLSCWIPLFKMTPIIVCFTCHHHPIPCCQSKIRYSPNKKCTGQG